MPKDIVSLRSEFEVLMASHGFTVTADSAYIANFHSQIDQAASTIFKKPNDPKKQGNPRPDDLFSILRHLSAALNDSSDFIDHEIVSYANPDFLGRRFRLLNIRLDPARLFVTAQNDALDTPLSLVSLQDFMENLPKGEILLPGELFAVPYKCRRRNSSEMAVLLVRPQQQATLG